MSIKTLASYQSIFFVFLLSFAIVSLRNLDPVLQPTLFAEDGTWLAGGLSQGWVAQLTQARTDYPVAIQVALLGLSTILSFLVSGNPIAFAPQAIAFISWCVFALLATVTFSVVSKVSNRKVGFFAAFAVVAIPVGSTANEIFGRILQLGFIIPIFAFMLMHLLCNRSYSPARKTAYQILLVACVLTNPVTGFLLLVQMVFEVFIPRKEKIQRPKATELGLITGSILTTFFFISGTNNSGSGIPGEFAPSGFIASFLGRAILYPFTFVFYTQLVDGTALLLAVIWLAIVVFAIIKSSGALRTFLMTASAVLVVWDFITVFRRPALTQYAISYGDTFPDRYYLGLNILSVIVILVSLYALLRNLFAKTHPLGSLLMVIFIPLAAFMFATVIYEESPRMAIVVENVTFLDQLCKPVGRVGSFDIIPIYPSPWQISLDQSLTEYCDPEK